jgi:hypothetical protein
MAGVACHWIKRLTHLHTVPATGKSLLHTSHVHVSTCCTTVNSRPVRPLCPGRSPGLERSVAYNGQTVPICEDAFFLLLNRVQRYARHDRGSLSSRKGTLKGVPYFEQLCFLAYRHELLMWPLKVSHQQVRVSTRKICCLRGTLASSSGHVLVRVKLLSR